MLAEWGLQLSSSPLVGCESSPNVLHVFPFLYLSELFQAASYLILPHKPVRTNADIPRGPSTVMMRVLM